VKTLEDWMRRVIPRPTSIAMYPVNQGAPGIEAFMVFLMT
jgi:hypothetical protein